MKKYLKNTFIIVFVLCMFNTLTAMANGINVKRDVDNQKFTISGISEPFSAIRTVVVAPGKTYLDAATALNPLDVVKYQTEFEAKDNGDFSFEVELAAESGVYTAYVAIDNAVEEVKLEYVDSENYINNSLIYGLNHAEDIREYIELNRDDLGFFFPLYDDINIDKDKVCSIISKEIPLSENNIEENIDIFNRAVIMSAISNGVITGVKEYSDSIKCLNDDSVVAYWYDMTNAEDVDAKLGNRFETIEAFDSALSEAIVLSVIKAPNGYLNVKEIISDFKDKIGISKPTSSDAVYRELAGKNFNSYAELKKEYQSVLTKYANANQQGTSNKGNGGGNGSSANLTPTVQREPMTPIVKKHFQDMENALWAQDACEYLAEKGILTGKSEGRFGPLDKITREEFVTVIVRTSGIEKYADNNVFIDLSKDDWCYEYVLAANQNGIINGVDEERFGKGMNITRQDMATILYRVINLKGINAGEAKSTVDFVDEDAIADYAKEAVDYLASRGIINGMSDGKFGGNDSALRAQAAQMIYNVLRSMEG